MKKFLSLMALVVSVNAFALPAQTPALVNEMMFGDVSDFQDVMGELGGYDTFTIQRVSYMNMEKSAQQACAKVTGMSKSAAYLTVETKDYTGQVVDVLYFATPYSPKDLAFCR